MSSSDSAILYIVATPIGNLADMTFRGVEILQAVDLIAAEDTRHSKFLLEHYKIKTPMTSLHGDNELHKTEKILIELSKGRSVALISDAGTPLISDPGSHCVQKARESGFSVVPVPGASALITALSVAGLSTKQFYFGGFLPNKQKARRDALTEHRDDMATLIYYESRHDIVDFLVLAAEVFGADRTAVVARELTKQFETIHQAALGEMLVWIQSDHNQQKGEYVVLIEGVAEKPQGNHIDEAQVLAVLCKQLPTKQAAKLLAEMTGGSQRDYYQRALTLKEDNS